MESEYNLSRFGIEPALARTGWNQTLGVTDAQDDADCGTAAVIVDDAHAAWR